MRQTGPNLILSATDLSNFLGCHHRTALDMEAAAGLRKRPHFDDPLLELLFQRGLEHEKAYVDSLRDAGRTILDLATLKDPRTAVDATTRALREGADVIVQGALNDGEWFGRPDIIQRIPTSSQLGEWSYEISDTKLARETRAGTILQLGLYSEMLGLAQGLPPEYFHVVTPNVDHPIHSFRVADYAAYFRLVRRQLATTVTRTSQDIAAEYYPEPVEHCEICPWSSECKHKRRADDHLSLVAGITRLQRRELEARGTRTLTALGALPLPIGFKPDRGSVESYDRVREQARLQVESKDKTPPLHQLREIREGEGLCRLPAPTPGDIFLDLEGDRFSEEGGREYLFGVVSIAADGSPCYRSYWGFTDRDERAAFEAVIDQIVAATVLHPGMHVYHYAPYEATAFKRLMGRYATRENEVDGMLRAGRFVDLYAVVRQGLQAGIERYSIKNLEPLYGFARAVALPDANRGLRLFEHALALGTAAELAPEIHAIVEGYNKDDCISTLRLRDWLETLRDEVDRAGTAIVRPTLNPPEPSTDLNERQRRTEDLRHRLLAGIDGIPAAGSADNARFLMAYLIDFHRREAKAEWHKYYELREATMEDLFDAPEAVVGLELECRVDTKLHAKSRKPTGTVTDRYRYPPQEMEIRRGSELKNRDGTKFGDVVACDRIARTLDVKKGKAQADAHPVAVFAHTYVSTSVLEESIAAIAEAIAGCSGCDGANGIATALLLGESPRLSSGVFAQPASGESASAFAVRVVGELDRTVLAIQGPPGSGKTYTGARMICALVAAGKKVGVMGPSHKVITNQLLAVVEAANEAGATVRIAQKPSEHDDEELDPCITSLAGNEEPLRLLAEGEIDVLGGTAWLWARPDMAGSVDVLFVDEAGQVSLANAIAVSAAATSMVLLGDPQQLDQPLKGSHPEGVDASALHHLLGSHKTIPRDRGVFLPVTWRLCPAICEFTSELFYESRLMPKPSSVNQALCGVEGIAGNGLWYVDVDHDGCTSASDEEVGVVVNLVARLTAPGSLWMADDRSTSPLDLDDILIVAPFNAHVSRLLDALPKGARVGTVDKFQGQQAPVVIYSMATSRPEDAPRGMEFLYSLNRLNVATSRAKCAAILVANPRLFSPECGSPRQMKLANALCRFREMARPILRPQLAGTGEFVAPAQK